MKKCIIFCAAEFDKLAAPIEKGDYILAADGGLRHLEKAGLVAYSHGDYFSLGKKLGDFGYSVRKKSTEKRRNAQKKAAGKKR